MFLGRWRGIFAMRSTVLLLCAAVMLTALPSWAAKVVNVRVGQHAEYDRIVFDLDGWAAYQVHSVAGNEILVRVLAETEAREITAEKGLVRSVKVTPAAQGSEVAIRLNSGDVQVKDMMLQSPSRIVIDVRRIKPVAAVTPPPPTPKPAAKPAPAAAPAPAPVVAVPKPSSAPEPTKVAEAPSTPAKPAPAPAVVPKPTPAPAAPPTSAQPPATAQKAPTATASKPTAIVKTPTPTPRPAPKAAPAQPAGAKKAPIAQKKPVPTPKKIAKKPAPAPTPAAESPGLDLRLVGAGVLILLVGVVGFVWHRRRSAGADFEDSEDAAIDGDWFGDSSETVVQDEDSELPIAVEHREVPLSMGDSSSEDDALPISMEQASEITEQEKQPTFFDSAESSSLDSGAETAVMEQSQPSLGQEPVGFAAGSVTSEGMVPLSQYQELEERLHKLEGRLSDIDSARERLEQQGVNQTEELRVQRAAIARTQRVLRTLTRPEEDVSDEPVPKG